MPGRADNFHPNDLMERLRPQALWAAAAAVALLFAVLSGSSDPGAQRLANILAALTGSSQTAPGPFDAQAATHQLAQAVQGLEQDRDRLTRRLADVERDMDDMTGSISRQIEAAKATSMQALAPWPTDQPAAAETSAAIAAMVAPSPTTSAMASSPDATAPGAASLPLGAASAPRPAAYGADIGSATSIKTLQTRWTGLHSAHRQLFEGLHPSLTLRENPRSSRTELRLVIGPLPNAEAAVRLCRALAAFKQSCQPTMFDGRLALQ